MKSTESSPGKESNPKKLTSSLSQCAENVSHLHAQSLPMENTGKFRHFYKIGHIIAKSNIGTIRKCLHLTTNQIRAVEFIPKKTIDTYLKGKGSLMEDLRILGCLLYTSPSPRDS